MSDKDLVKQQWLERYPRSFPKADKSVTPVPGAIAVSRAGRDRYRRFIVTKVLAPEMNEKHLRVLVCDGLLRQTETPKKKNLSHLILIGMSERAAALIADGKLDDKTADEILSEYR